MITLIDEATTTKIRSLGSLKAIVISHPHYYSTYAKWAEAFLDVPLYISSDDIGWLCQKSPPRVQGNVQFLNGPAGTTKEVVEGVTAIKAGGHFDGSLLLHWGETLFIADTILIVPVRSAPCPLFITLPNYLLTYHLSPDSLSLLAFQPYNLIQPTTQLTGPQSARTPHPRPPGQTSFVFQWSIPNMIPLPPGQILQIWNAIKSFNFDSTLGAFNSMEVRDADVKKRIVESMKIQVRGEGWEEHEVLRLEA